jgi:hypothetical protein
MECFVKNVRRKDYNLHVQYELCGVLSTTKSSVTSITSTSTELVDVATDMTLRKSVTLFQNTSQEYTTTVLQEDIHKRSNESDKAFTIIISTDPPRPNDNKEPENSEEGASGTQNTPYSKRVTETQGTSEAEPKTTPKSETGGLSDVNKLTVFVILPITIGVAVFVSLVAVNYVTRRCMVHHPQHHIQGEASHVTARSDIALPLLNPQLRTDFTMQGPGQVNRSSDVGGTDYHVYEEIC